jgi:probable rRNA maturation factor
MEGALLAQPKSQPLILGDVVISLPAARCQAKAAGVRLRDELALLWVHGLLHLAGYDHARKSDEKHMFALQDSILGRAGRRVK